MQLTFPPFTCKTKDSQTFLKGECAVELTSSCTKTINPDKVIVIPSANFKINYIVNVNGHVDKSLDKSVYSKFWQDTFYTIDADRVKCQIFTPAKIALLKSNSQMYSHYDTFISELELMELVFHFDALNGQPSCDLVNFYFVSLLLSQLEIQFPLVFSRKHRHLAAVNLEYIGSLSYSLSGSASLLVPFVCAIQNNLSYSSLGIMGALPKSRKPKSSLLLVASKDEELTAEKPC